MKVKVIPIVVGALGTVQKSLEKRLKNLEIRGRIETIQNTALLQSARILRRVMETCCHSDSSEIPSANTGGENSIIISFTINPCITL